jgi:hypothetical protein
MDSRQTGRELSQLSRILFDGAARNWYASAGIETFAGIFGAVLRRRFAPLGLVWQDPGP